ncbi:lanC-like protein 2 [Platysternon megacephalum]|uniref:LanC-like protein 2 n=1 Tax=Platysternon megacephalum TaxID=55544 RepID=A0A4D9EAQ6_9SAUR|nr:lanC-like protein 2 [Platysternon megacephalum]
MGPQPWPTPASCWLLQCLRLPFDSKHEGPALWSFCGTFRGSVLLGLWGVTGVIPPPNHVCSSAVTPEMLPPLCWASPPSPPPGAGVPCGYPYGSLGYGALHITHCRLRLGETDAGREGNSMRLIPNKAHCAELPLGVVQQGK